MSTLPRITTFQIIFEGILLLPGIICQPNNLKFGVFVINMETIFVWYELNSNLNNTTRNVNEISNFFTKIKVTF